jgi:hypothetical protein
MPVPTQACPDAGAGPNDLAADNCRGNVPIITASGTYSFTMTGQTHDYTLPCAPNYPGQRDVVFEICNANAGPITLSAGGPTGAVYTIGLGSTCGASDQTCGFDNGTPVGVTVQPGVYYVVIEGYQDGAGTLNVTLPPPSPPSTPAGPPFGDCCAAQQFFDFHGGTPGGTLFDVAGCAPPSGPDIWLFSLPQTSQVTLSMGLPAGSRGCP